MSATDTLQRIAELLSGQERERFLMMCTRFQSVPEDDEYLQLLEAIGLMTLLWREVPEEIESILSKASPLSPNHQQLEKHIGEAASKAIPTYEDSRRIVERLENLETALRRMLTGAKKPEPQSNRKITFAALFATGFIAHEFIGIFINLILL